MGPAYELLLSDRQKVQNRSWGGIFQEKIQYSLYLFMVQQSFLASNNT